MRKLIAGLVFIAFFGSLTAQNEWSGLWRISRIYEGQVDSIYHLFVGPDAENMAVTIYPEAARPMTIQALDFQAARNRLEVRASNSESQPLPMDFVFIREQDRMSGEWLFSHMQFGTMLSGQLQGFRVIPDPYWQPWLDVEVRRPERFLDLATLLATEAPRQQFSDFQSFWDREIERNYYFVLQQWVYGKGSDPVAHKQERLKALFELLQREDVRQRLAGSLPGIVERVVETVSQSVGAENVQIFLLSLPSSPADYEEFLWTRIPTPEEEAGCRCKLDLRERFIFLDPLEFSATGPGPILTEKQALIRTLWADTRGGLPMRIFREALAIQLALEAQGVDWELSAPNLLAARLEFAELLLNEKPGMDQQLEQNLASTLSYTLGLGFVRELRKSQTMTDLLRRTPQDIMRDWKEYLGEMASSE